MSGWFTKIFRKAKVVSAEETGAAPIAVAFDSTANSWLFRIPRSRSAISGFCAFIEKRLPPDYVDTDTLRAFQVAFDELLTNVVAHADGPAEEPIDVLLRRNSGEISATIRYRASAYDPTRLPRPDTEAPMDARPIGGLGVHLVREMMDEFSHRYVQGCNELHLTRRSARIPAPAQP